MLHKIKLTNVGPAPSMEMDLGSRLNLLTGDNGLGKSFLLDICWWALTQKWPAEVNKKLRGGLQAIPYGPDDAAIKIELDSKTVHKHYTSTFNRKRQQWVGEQGRPWNPGLVIYAQVDGSFSIWDPARNYWIDRRDTTAYVFTPQEVWEGTPGKGSKYSTEGLIRDWIGWQKEQGPAFDTLKAVLRALSPSDDELLEPGTLRSFDIPKSKEIPTLKMAYGQEISILHASAGMRRAISLAYLLVWSWIWHQRASEDSHEGATKQVILLVDEIEAHLHPKWQRRIVGALLSVMRNLAPDTRLQLITATHSPMIMASVEPEFNAETDKWFDLDLVTDAPGTSRVELTERPFERRGEVSRWLTSKAFDLKEARSLEAERVIARAIEALESPAIEQERGKQITRELLDVLGEVDPFWIRWRSTAVQKGWLE